MRERERERSKLQVCLVMVCTETRLGTACCVGGQWMLSSRCFLPCRVVFRFLILIVPSQHSNMRIFKV